MAAVETLITDHLDLWSAALKRKSAAGRGSSSKVELYGIKKLRELILELAVRGLLVPQDPNDEAASELLKKIAAEKAKLVKEGKSKKEKPLPPISENDKLYGLPDGWVWARLGSFGDTNIGLTYRPSDVSDSGTPVLRSSNIQNGKIDLTDLVRVSGVDIKESAMLSLGDLLICARNGSKALVGKTAQIKNLNEAMCFGAFMAIFRSSINGYIEIFLNSPIFRKTLDGVDTTTINQITQANLISTLAPIPPYAEQHRIVAKVDELMALCDQLEQQTEASLGAHQTLVEALLSGLTSAADHAQFASAWQRIAGHFDTLFKTEESIAQLKQTILQLAVMGKLVPQDPNDEPASELLKKIAAEKAKLVKEGKIKKEKPLPPITDVEKPFNLPRGWRWARFGSFGYTNIGLTYKPSNVGDTGIPVLRSSNIQNAKIDLSDLVRVSGLEIKESALVGLGDLLICARNGSKALVGKTAQIKTLSEPMCFGAFMAIFRSNLNNFIEVFLNSPEFRKSLDGVDTTTINQLTQANLIGTLAPIPPLAEQHRIVAKVDELIALCDQLKSRLSDAQTTQLHLADALVEQAIG